MKPKHPVSLSCKGERCEALATVGALEGGLCREPATHKLGEEIAFDDPNPHRHNLTAYVCCKHFVSIVGTAGGCE